MVCTLFERVYNALLTVVLVSAPLFLSPFPAGACGADSDCTIASGDYRIYLPVATPTEAPREPFSPPPTGPSGDQLANNDLASVTQKTPGEKTGSPPEPEKIPLIIFIHGLGGSSADMLARPEYRALADSLKVAFVAVNGLDHSWTFPGGVRRTNPPRDEFTYIAKVLSDVTSRFPVDPKKVILAGFSIGASMTWNIACRDPAPYAGFITVAGTFWRPLPEKCAVPIENLYHFHGTADRTFPLSGRIVKGMHQGDIFDAFKVLYNQDACTRVVDKSFEFVGHTCKRHETCGGKTVQLCLHGRGHVMRPFFLEAGFYQIAKAHGWSGNW